MATEKTPMWAPEHPPGSELKGGGYRGGPKRWTGKGPRPARHVPWPEIFKHHLSVLEGHQKMIDMVRKHTVAGTGNWQTINGMLERCHEMLAMTKKTSRDFVPPPNLRDQVPIGSSSASMYPGYSPADVKYGEAAQEYGNAVSKARASSANITSGSEGPEYQIGQSKGISKERSVHSTSANTASTNYSADVPAGKPADGETNEYFVVDSFPAQTNGSGQAASIPSIERSVTAEEISEKSKQAKISQEVPFTEAAQAVEHKDISKEVDARMRAKEERRKAKKEKKRKRESKEDAVRKISDSGMGEDGSDAAERPVEKPQKKKSKRAGEPVSQAVETDDKKRRNKDEESEGRKKKKKQKKESE